MVRNPEDQFSHNEAHFKSLNILSTPNIVSDLVRNPEDQFSHNEAHFRSFDILSTPKLQFQSVVVTPDPSQTSIPVGAGLQPKAKLPGISSSEAAANWLKSAQTESSGDGEPSSAVQRAAVSIMSLFDKSNVLSLASSKDSDQRVNLPSLISLGYVLNW